MLLKWVRFNAHTYTHKKKWKPKRQQQQHRQHGIGPFDGLLRLCYEDVKAAPRRPFDGYAYSFVMLHVAGVVWDGGSKCNVHLQVDTR